MTKLDDWLAQRFSCAAHIVARWRPGYPIEAPLGLSLYRSMTLAL